MENDIEALEAQIEALLTAAETRIVERELALLRWRNYTAYLTASQRPVRGHAEEIA